MRCSPEIAVKLGAFKARMEGPIARVPFDCLPVLAAGEIWLWPLEPGVLAGVPRRLPPARQQNAIRRLPGPGGLHDA